MVGFLRRYTFDPGLDELLKIEGVATIDRDPPPEIVGVSTGAVCVVGEFEDGPCETPLEMAGGGDVQSTFGSFGFFYDGVPANHPAARSRRADGATRAEYWNGNGFVALVRKRFPRLIICRVDTSIGEVQFTRLASISGGGAFTFDLEPGQTLVFDVGAGNVTATYAAAVATILSADGVYPTTFAGGEKVTLMSEGVQYQVVFLSTDQTHSDVVSRINQTLGYTAAVASTLKTRLNGTLRGLAGRVQIVSIDAAVATATGWAAASAVAGTGDAQNIDQVTVAELDAKVNAASATTHVDRDADGNVRLYTTSASIQVDATTTATLLGFATEETAAAAAGADGSIPAGTRVKTGAGLEFVTTQTVAVAADSAGPYRARVRHALDDGAGGTASVSAITTVTAPISLGAFSVTNGLPIAAALTEAAIDAKYQSALAATKSISSVAREINVVVSARQSNAIRTELRSNAIDASANGCFGRLAVIRPPLGTTRAAARSTTSQPGVGAYRDQRVVYAFPGARTNMPQIALRGVAGGAGFTADGNVDVGADSFWASLMAQLPPEENPGQETTFLDGIVAIETGADVQSMDMGDYVAFKRAGIAALRINGGTAFMQSGVTSVDPALYPNLKNIARRRMADFIEDTIAIQIVLYSKKLATRVRKALIISTVGSFLDALESKDNPTNQRVAGSKVDGKGGNTKAASGLGLFRVGVKVTLLGSLDVIVFDSEIGENVEFVQFAEAA